MRHRRDRRTAGTFLPTGRLLTSFAAAVAAAGGVGGAASSAQAESSWLKAIGGDWSDPSRWSSGVPAGSDAVFGVMPSGRAFEVAASQAVSVASLTIRNQSPIFRFLTPDSDDLVVNGSLSVGGPTAPLWTVRESHVVCLGEQRIGTDEGPGSLLIDGTGSSSTGQYFTTASLRVGDGAEGSIMVGASGLLQLTSPPNSPVASVVGAGPGGLGSITFLGNFSWGAVSNQANLSFGVSGGAGTATVGTGAIFAINVAAVRLGGDGPGIETGGVGSLTLDGGMIAGNGSLIVGSEGTGTLLSHAGAIQMSLVVGEKDGVGSVVVDGPSAILTVKGAPDASEGHVLVTGAGTQCSITNVFLAQHVDGVATLTVAPGAIANLGQVQVAQAGAGELSVEGHCAITAGLRLRPALSGPNSTALVDVHGRDAELNASSIDLGPGDHAHLLVRDGGIVATPTLTSQTNTTALIDVGEAGSLSATSATLSAGTLQMAPGATAYVGSLNALGGTVAWKLGARSAGGPATLSGQFATFKGPISVTFEGGFEPAAGTDIPLATAQYLLTEQASSLAIQAVHGYPPFLVGSRRSLSLHIIDHIDAFDIPATFEVANLQFTLPTIVHADGISSDVSRQATWSFNPPGMIERTGPATFVALTPGTATGTVQFGAASATVEFLIDEFAATPIELVSAVETPSGTVAGNADSYDASLVPTLLGVGPQAFADGGRLVVFGSKASNFALGDSGQSADVFVKDTVSLSIERESIGTGGTSGGEGGAMTPDGRYVAFSSTAYLTSDPHSVMGSKIYLRDRVTGAIEYVSLPEATGSLSGGSTRPLLTSDARYVAFDSTVPLVPEDTSTVSDVYVRDRVAETFTRISVGVGGAQLTVPSTLTSVAANAGQIAYVRLAFGGAKVPYVYDIASQVTEMAVPGLIQPIPQIIVGDARLSADGRYLIFLSGGTGVLYDGPLATTAQVYRRDRLLGITEPVTMNASGAWAIAPIEGMAISDDGRYVAFVTKAPNILPGIAGGDGISRLYRKDMLTGVIEYYSVGELRGTPVPFSDPVMPDVALSGDGRRVAFATKSTNLILGVPPSKFQIYVADIPVPPFGDLNGDFAVDPTDLAILLGDWAGSHYDLDGDGVVGASDLAILLGAW